ncbi:MAG: hypothetical protein P8M25_06350 [Paracoccaceae bacterium]|nr:hypothetical protein [Paracoccaceae bacterium]
MRAALIAMMLTFGLQAAAESKQVSFGGKDMFLWMIVMVEFNGPKMIDIEQLARGESWDPEESTLFFENEEKCTQGLLRLGRENGRGTLTFSKKAVNLNFTKESPSNYTANVFCVPIKGPFAAE